MGTAPAIIILLRQPQSINAESRPRFQFEVAAEAPRMVAGPLTGSHLHSMVHYFHRGASTIVADNYEKPGSSTGWSAASLRFRAFDS